MAQDKQHVTTEQLSVLLDREASAEEQAQWEAHLSTCPQCQRVLTALRQTVAVLHALPQPMPPRSFVLPVEIAEPISHPVAADPTPIRPARRRLNPYVRGALRTMSALAAMIGVVFFLSGILPSLVHGGGTASSSASTGSFTTSNGQSSASSSGHIGMGTKAPTAEKANMLSPIATSIATSVVQPQSPGTTDQQPYSVAPSSPSSEPTFLLFNLSTPAGRVGLGMILVLLGGMGFVLFKRSRRVR